MAKHTGPVEEGTWPEQLRAHVVEPSADPRIHGYAARSDLAHHYSYADLVLLAATGELPDAGRARALEVVLWFLAPASVAEAPIHAACLSKLCDATPSATLGVSAIALAEQARFVLDEHEHLLEWLEKGASGPPPITGSDADAAAVAELRRALEPTGLGVPVLELRPPLTAALIATLHALGLRSRVQLELCWTLARLPVALAEAACVRPLAFRDYPMNTPQFRYESPR